MLILKYQILLQQQNVYSKKSQNDICYIWFVEIKFQLDATDDFYCRSY